MTQDEKNEQLKSLRFKLNQQENKKRTYLKHGDKIINKTPEEISDEITLIDEEIKYYEKEILKLNSQ